MKNNLTTRYLLSLLCAIGLFACLKSYQPHDDIIHDASQQHIVANTTPLNTPVNASSNAEDESPGMNLPAYILPALPLARTQDLSLWDTDNTGIQLVSRLYRPPRTRHI